MIQFSYETDTFSSILSRVKSILNKDIEINPRHSIKEYPMLYDENNVAITMMNELEVGNKYFLDLFNIWGESFRNSNS